MGAIWLALLAVVVGGCLLAAGIAGIRPPLIVLGALCMAFAAIYGARGRVPTETR